MWRSTWLCSYLVCLRRSEHCAAAGAAAGRRKKRVCLNRPIIGATPHRLSPGVVDLVSCSRLAACRRRGARRRRCARGACGACGLPSSRRTTKVNHARGLNAAKRVFPQGHHRGRGISATPPIPVHFVLLFQVFLQTNKCCRVVNRASIYLEFSGLGRTYYAVLGGVEIGTGTLSQVTQPERAGCVVYPPSHRRS